MSITNLALVTLSYQKIGVVDETNAPSAEQGATSLSVLNNILADYEKDGMYLGWFAQTNLAATCPLQDSDVNGVSLLLAVSLANHYGIPIAPALAAEAEAAMGRLMKRTRPIAEANLSELPRPQGPWGWGQGFW